MSAPNLSPIPEIAQRFLLGLEPNPAEVFTFLTLDDSGQKRGHLLREFSGSFASQRDQLIDLSNRGAGVFVTVNKTDGTGRKAGNVIAPRALFVDKDTGELPKLNPEPSILVRSKRGHHAYYCLKNGEPLEAFSRAQKALIHHLGTDPSIHDLPRVMRIPGFPHLKDLSNPFMVQLEAVRPHRYSIAEILSAYPAREAGGGREKDWLRGFTGDVSTLCIVSLFKAVDLYFSPLGGEKHAAICPWRDSHTTGQDGDSSTAIFEAEDGGFPSFKCLHGHCADKGLEEVLKLFGDELVSRHCSESYVTHSLIPVDLAEEYLQSKGLRAESGLKLRYFQDDFYLYSRNRYRRIPRTDVRTEVTAFLQERRFTRKMAGSRLSNEILTNVDALARLDSATEVPSFLDGTLENPKRIIAVRNGLLSVDRVLANHPEPLLAHTPAFFSPICLPYNYDPKAMCERWKAFLEEMIPDSEIRDALQGWFGYNLIPDTSLHKFVMLKGDGANGKSVICTVLQTMLGLENVSAVPLDQIRPDRPFSIAATFGKSANIVEEASSLDKAAEAELKKFVGGALMSAERKYKDPFEFHATARITFASNVLPNFKDPSDGLWRRLLMIPLTRQILDESKQDKRLIRGDWWIESGEIQGVLNWAFVGLRRVLKEGRLVEPKVCAEAKAAFKRDSNATRIFLIERYCEEGGGVTSSNQLHRDYVSWAKESGTFPLSRASLNEEVRRTFPSAELTENAHRQSDSSRSRVWKNLRTVGGRQPWE
jgi:P4 family phage/plasmid primase-like protien